MTAPPELLPTPYARVFSCGLQHLGSGTRGFRPTGTREWLLIATLGGEGAIQVDDGHWETLVRGDLLLIAPHVKQTYGHGDADGSDPDTPAWTNIWTHFLPRSHWIAWLKWPELGRGIMRLRCGDAFDDIEAGMHDMIVTAQRPRRLAVEAAMNRLERVLISADALNPVLNDKVVHDPRIRRAMDLVAEALQQPWSVEDLAARVGLSRSRFATLFAAQVGQPPQVFIESTRLARAAQLLQATTRQIQLIAEDVGFADPLYFSTRFRRQYGLSPAGYRARHASAEPPGIGA